MNCVVPRSECVYNEPAIDKIIAYYRIPINGTKLKSIMTFFNIKHEIDIWSHAQVLEVLGIPTTDHILFKYYKLKGPRNTTELLSNHMIDNILQKWALNANSLFGKSFYSLPCQSRDFNRYNNDVYDLDLNTLLAHDAFAVVFNTDVHTGPGLHWICVFINTKSKEIAFFNSSSNPPPLTIDSWMTDLKFKLKNRYNLDYTVTNNVITTPVQFSQTECGVWCLLFIHSMLLDYTFDWVRNATDKTMTEFRRLLFA